MPARTPTVIQLLGLAVTLAAVVAYSLFTLVQLDGLKRLGSDIVDRNRRDSLQLIRIQNDLSQIGLAMRDITEGAVPYPMESFKPEFDRIKGDLEDALAVEARLMPSGQTTAQRSMLQGAFTRFWNETAQLWALAGEGKTNDAKTLIRTRLEAERATMTTVISRLLMQNNEAEAAAVQEIQLIYGKVERNLYLFFAAVLAAIMITGGLVIRHDRRMFARVSHLSEQRKELAGKVITVQEDVFRTLARELHDEFGQVLTALGMMLLRVEKKMPDPSAERDDLREVREIANQTLERVRGMSQMLHPPVLDDYGLEKSIEWYLRQFQKQTGVHVHYEKAGVGPWIGEKVAIHVYRILQEGLNNVVRHAKTPDAWVRVRYEQARMEMEIEDHGPGLPAERRTGGIGMIGMRERAELLGGHIEFERPVDGGTRVKLSVPLPAGEKA
ncbi:MAG: sensor histidine kinase [Bryobacterales bacterium]|nr:sensor histidine kinase [Bryobacterales bacterium]